MDGRNATNGQRVIIRRAGRRRKHHFGGPQIRSVMPRRPRKPPTAFNCFIQQYFQSPMARNFFTTAESMRYAANYWRTNPNIHAQFASQVRQARVKFERDLAEYKRRHAVLKRPGNAYIIFAREMYEREGNGRGIREFGPISGQAWRRMSRQERQPFVERANDARRRHQQMIRDLNSGRTRIEQYLPQGPTN